MNKIIILLLLLIMSCALNKVHIYNISDHFIDIEVTKDNFYMDCFVMDKKEHTSIMAFYVVDGDVVHEFIFRAISDTNWCKNKVKKTYKKLIKGVSTIRIVGITPTKSKENNLQREDGIPDKFKRPKQLTNWIFIRLETKNGCKAYFDNGCKPENYWGGLFPQN